MVAAVVEQTVARGESTERHKSFKRLPRKRRLSNPLEAIAGWLRRFPRPPIRGRPSRGQLRECDSTTHLAHDQSNLLRADLESRDREVTRMAAAAKVLEKAHTASLSAKQGLEVELAALRAQHDTTLQELARAQTEREAAWQVERSQLSKELSAGEQRSSAAERRASAEVAELQAALDASHVERDEALALLTNVRTDAAQSSKEQQVVLASAERQKNRTRDELLVAREELSAVRTKLRQRCPAKPLATGADMSALSAERLGTVAHGTLVRLVEAREVAVAGLGELGARAGVDPAFLHTTLLSATYWEQSIELNATSWQRALPPTIGEQLLPILPQSGTVAVPRAALAMVAAAPTLLLFVLACVRICGGRRRRRVSAPMSASTNETDTRLAAAARIITVRGAAKQASVAAAIHRWGLSVGSMKRRAAGQRGIIASCIRTDDLNCISHLFHRWLSIVVGLQSALQQQLLQQSALEQVAREYEYATASEGASRPGGGHGYITPSLRGEDTTRRRLYQRDPTLEDSTSRTELSTSLRTLGANMLVLAKSTPMDVRTVAAAPRALLHGARRLMPRLAVHASPTRLLASMVKELNETIATSVATSTTLETTHDGGSSSRYLDACADAHAPESGNRGTHELHLTRSDGVSVPTEEALRQHNEMQIGDAAAAAAALLARLQHEQRFDRESATSGTK